MTHHPTHFTDEQVQAAVGGTKTQHRVPVVPQPVGVPVTGIQCDWIDCGVEPEKNRYGFLDDWDKWVSPFGGPGDKLTIPVRASLLLDVVSVRVERVQSITDTDVRAEGVEQQHIDKNRQWFHRDDIHGLAFMELWNARYAKPRVVRKRGQIDHYVSYPWEAGTKTQEHRGKPWLVFGNPWVWGVDFEAAAAAKEGENNAR